MSTTPNQVVIRALAPSTSQASGTLVACLGIPTAAEEATAGDDHIFTIGIDRGEPDTSSSEPRTADSGEFESLQGGPYQAAKRVCENEARFEPNRKTGENGSQRNPAGEG